jgi:hypothetical protein
MLSNTAEQAGAWRIDQHTPCRKDLCGAPQHNLQRRSGRLSSEQRMSHESHGHLFDDWPVRKVVGRLGRVDILIQLLAEVLRFVSAERHRCIEPLCDLPRQRPGVNDSSRKCEASGKPRGGRFLINEEVSFELSRRRYLVGHGAELRAALVFRLPMIAPADYKWA